MVELGIVWVQLGPWSIGVANTAIHTHGAAGWDALVHQSTGLLLFAFATLNTSVHLVSEPHSGLLLCFANGAEGFH